MSLTPSSFNQIFVDMDTVSRMLARLMSNLDEFPDPKAVAKTSGPSADVAAKYSIALGAAAERASKATKDARVELLGMDQTIREVVAALAAHDAGAVADAKQLNKFLDDAAADVAAETNSGATTTADTKGTVTEDTRA